MTATVAAQPLSGPEALLWTIERDPVLRSTIVVVAMLRGTVSRDRLRRRLGEAVAGWPRLRQRIGSSRLGRLQWVDAGPIDVDQHVTHVKLPPPATERGILDLAGGLAGTSFDPARPLWSLTVVHGVPGRRTAVVFKVHHAMTDGVGGFELLPLLADATPGADGTAHRIARAPRDEAPRRDGGIALRPALGAVVEGVTHPWATLAAGPRLVESTLRLLAPAGGACSPLLVGRGLDRHLTTLDVPRDELAAAGHRVGGTLNDAFLAAVVGGVARYHARHDVELERLRITMPISVRAPGDPPGGNRFAPARFVVPVRGDDDTRMRHLGEVARRWRHEPAVALTAPLAALLERLPPETTSLLFGSMLKGVDLVATNVHGLDAPVSIAGAELEGLYAFAPPAGAAVNVALVSHLDRCCVGINADTLAVAEPLVLHECLDEAFTALLARSSARRVHQ